MKLLFIKATGKPARTGVRPQILSMVGQSGKEETTAHAQLYLTGSNYEYNIRGVPGPPGPPGPPGCPPPVMVSLSPMTLALSSSGRAFFTSAHHKEKQKPEKLVDRFGGKEKGVDGATAEEGKGVRSLGRQGREVIAASMV